MNVLAASVVFVVTIAVGTLGLAGYLATGNPAAPRPQATIPAAAWQPPVAPLAGTALPAPSRLAALPTRTAAPPTPIVASLPPAVPSPSPRARQEERLEAWSAPAALPTASLQRDGCDPAYPEERTCIPPGPPFDQGCAVTDERRFKVLPPDPQRLDHDNDGIGCEPIGTG